MLVGLGCYGEVMVLYWGLGVVMELVCCSGIKVL